MVEGRTLYLAGPEYTAEYARRLGQLGVRVIGGCCRRVPAMIREMRVFIRSFSLAHQAPVTALGDARKAGAPVGQQPVPVAERTELARRLMSGRFCVSVELDPPPRPRCHPHPRRRRAALPGGRGRGQHPGWPAGGRADGPTALSMLVRQRIPQLETVVHSCCRDRNLLGMQMDLLGAQALGLDDILAVTGDPPKMGTYPDAAAVFDIDAIGLTTFTQMMNRGLDFSDQPIGGQTSHFAGCGCNPGAVDLDLEAARFARKVEAGAESFFSQPVVDPDLHLRFIEKTEGRRAVVNAVPFLVGIMPLVSAKNAEFLHNEVPGMQIPAAVLPAIRAAPSREAQREGGIELARETLLEVMNHPRIRGAYVFPPFGSYRAGLLTAAPGMTSSARSRTCTPPSRMPPRPSTTPTPS